MHEIRCTKKLKLQKSEVDCLKRKTTACYKGAAITRAAGDSEKGIFLAAVGMDTKTDYKCPST